MAKHRGHRRKPKAPHKQNGAKPKEGRLEGSSRGSKSAESTSGVINEHDVPIGDVSSWGKGGVLTNLQNPAEVSKDIALIQRAITQRWGVQKKELIQNRLLKVLQKEEVTIASKEGPLTVEEPADRNAVAAARVLVQMNGQDIECEQFDVKQGKPPVPGTQVNVFANSSQPGLSPILQLARNLGAREVIIDGSAVSITDSAGQSQEAGAIQPATS